MTNTPNVFISYSWDNENGNNEHKEWVSKLAKDLRSHGVNVTLDQFDVRLGDDLPSFMERGLTASHIVLCVCSENYVRKCNAVTSGVGYEKRILADELLNDVNKKIIIPIVKNNRTDNKLPTFLSGILYEDFDKGDYANCYDNLIRRIYDEDIKKKPQLGECPFVGSSLSDKITTNMNLQTVNFNNPSLEGKVSFDYKKNDGLFSIGVSDYSFTTMWSECGNGSIYCYNDMIKRIGYNPAYKQFPSKGELIDFDYSARCKSLKIGEVIILENCNNRFAAIRILNVKTNTVDINHLLEFEYKIYDVLETE